MMQFINRPMKYKIDLYGSNNCLVEFQNFFLLNFYETENKGSS